MGYKGQADVSPYFEGAECVGPIATVTWTTHASDDVKRPPMAVSWPVTYVGWPVTDVHWLASKDTAKREENRHPTSQAEKSPAHFPAGKWGGMGGNRGEWGCRASVRAFP